jgi:hypothetical protein
MLARQHGGARRHADHVLDVRAPIVDAGSRQRIEVGCARDPAAIHSDRIEALLIGGDEEHAARIGSRRGTRFMLGLSVRSECAARKKNAADHPLKDTGCTALDHRVDARVAAASGQSSVASDGGSS